MKAEACPKPLRGVAAARWFARFLIDPVGLVREMHREGRSLAAVGRIVPGRRREQLHVVDDVYLASEYAK